MAAMPPNTSPGIRMSRLGPIAVAGLVGAAAITAALGHGATRWQKATRTLRAELIAARRPAEASSYDPAELAELPAPVRRYLETVLRPGQPMIDHAELQQVGTFNLSSDSDRWRPFTATHLAVTRRPGFLWEARIAMAPGLPARVHDGYVDQTGILHASLVGLFTVAQQRGTAEIAEGEFTRFLAEAPWYPTVLLPSQGTRWEPVDDCSAMATCDDGAHSVSLLFRFGSDGLVASVHSPARGRSAGGRTMATPWTGHWSDYRRHDGVLIPCRGEACWDLPEGSHPYWRGRITQLRYHYVPAAAAP